jgi:hypothetical protein
VLLAFKVSCASHGSVILARRIVQFHTSPLANCKFGCAQVTQYTGLGALAACYNDTITQSEITNGLNTHNGIRCGRHLNESSKTCLNNIDLLLKEK